MPSLEYVDSKDPDQKIFWPLIIPVSVTNHRLVRAYNAVQWRVPHLPRVESLILVMFLTPWNICKQNSRVVVLGIQTTSSFI